MKKLFILFVFFPTLLAANSFTAIKYTLKPVVNQRFPVLEVEATFFGNFNDNVIFNLPHKWSNVSYIEQVKNIKVKDANVKFMVKQEKTHQLILKTPPAQSLTITYELHQKKGDPSDIHETMIRHDIIHTTGHGLLITPEGTNQQLQVNIAWVDMPKAWKTMSSHGTKPLLSFTADKQGINHAFYAAGDLRLYESVHKEGPFYLSIYGQFKVKDKEISKQLSQIVNSQRQFFGDNQFPYFAVSLIQSENPKTSGGISLTNSLTAFMPYKSTKKDFTMLAGHEHLHNWIGDKVSSHSTDLAHFWWREGFAEYFTRVIALNAGSITFKEFIDECDLFLRSYITSPVINASNAQIEKDFWTNHHIENLPYFRGFIFALYLNALIKKNDSTKSVADILRDLVKAGLPFSVQQFQEVAKAYIPQGIEKDLEKYITHGETFDLSIVAEFLPIEARKQKVGKPIIQFKKELTEENEVEIKSFFK